MEADVKFDFAGKKIVVVGFDKFERAYNTIRRDILEEEGIEYIEIPRFKLKDGRDVITAQVRDLWKAKGWNACREFLPEALCDVLEKEASLKSYGNKS